LNTEESIAGHQKLYEFVISSDELKTPYNVVVDAMEAGTTKYFDLVALV
jgi:hypothetical protein